LIDPTNESHPIVPITCRNSLAFADAQYTTLQHAATFCNILHHTATHTATHTTTHPLSLTWCLSYVGTLSFLRTHNTPHCVALQHTIRHCNTLQHTAKYNTLQHTATHCNSHCNSHCNTPSLSYTLPLICRNSLAFADAGYTTLQHTVTHCNSLQHTASHCNTLQHPATHCNTL